LSSAVPDRFAPVVAAVEDVCSQLGARGTFRPLGPERWICDVELSWIDAVEHVAFVLDTDGPLLAVYVVLRLPGAVDRADALAQAIARANYGLLPGCFELEIGTGEIRYRSVLELIVDDVATRPVAQLLSRGLLMTNTYAPAFERVVQAGADPLEAIDEIETA
jgi:hypothetical protein